MDQQQKQVRKHRDIETKMRAIRMVTREGLSREQVSSVLEIPHSTVCNWLKKHDMRMKERMAKARAGKARKVRVKATPVPQVQVTQGVPALVDARKYAAAIEEIKRLRGGAGVGKDRRARQGHPPARLSAEGGGRLEDCPDPDGGVRASGEIEGRGMSRERGAAGLFELLAVLFIALKLTHGASRLAVAHRVVAAVDWPGGHCGGGGGAMADETGREAGAAAVFRPLEEAMREEG